MYKLAAVALVLAAVAVNALNTVQVVNTNANLQSYSNEGAYNQHPSRVYVAGNLQARNYRGGFYDNSPYPYQSYGGSNRYRRQALIREANSQYQNQGNSQYEERFDNSGISNSYTPWARDPRYRYRETNQYQIQGNAQSKAETNYNGDNIGNSGDIGEPINGYQSQQQGAVYQQRYRY